PIGVSPSGAADAVALRLGNRLVGNPEGAAALEMTLLGGAFLFRDDIVVALTGADFGATVDRAHASPWASFVVRARSTLRVGSTRSGARCYLCVQGGIQVKPFLGSSSTHIMTGMGGFEGRALRAGDVLTIGPAHESFRKQSAARHALERLAPRKTLRVTLGEQSDWFPESSWRTLVEGTYRVLEQSNRMGIRIEGVPI